MPNDFLKSDPDVMGGVLCFAGTRVPVKHLYDYIDAEATLEEFLADFPTVSRESVLSVVAAMTNNLPPNAPASW